MCTVFFKHDDRFKVPKVYYRIQFARFVSLRRYEYLYPGCLNRGTYLAMEGTAKTLNSIVLQGIMWIKLYNF